MRSVANPMKRMFLFAFVPFWLATIASSQSTVVGSAHDWPDSRARGSSKDSASLDELRVHRSSLGGAPLRDMEARGTMTFAWEHNAVEHGISLQIFGSDYYRLDVEDAPYASIRVSPVGSGIQKAGNAPQPFNSENIFGGYLTLARIRDDLSSRSDISLTDIGDSNVDNISTHEISMHAALHKGAQLNPSGRGMVPVPMTATNLYLSKTSHLLIKTSTSAAAVGRSGSTLLVEDRFDDYRQVGGVMVPFKMTETVGGSVVFAMQFSDVKINQGISDTAFHF
jgi:hypothetical protein